MADWSDRYPYTEAMVKAHAPVGGGVYHLINAKDGQYPAFYIGETNELERRLLEHLGPSEPNAGIKRHLAACTCLFRFLEESLASERKSLEQEQIEKYKPSCND